MPVTSNFYDENRACMPIRLDLRPLYFNAPNPQYSALLSLPGETRNMIYEFVYGDPGVFAEASENLTRPHVYIQLDEDDVNTGARKNELVQFGSAHRITGLQDTCRQIRLETEHFNPLWKAIGGSSEALLCVFDQPNPFEYLMRDHTGANWLAHFLNGTSSLLRLQGPSLLEPQDDGTKQRQVFLLNIRIFEISRALIYTEPTFLATPEWSKAIDTYSAQHPASWTPKEALFDVLPQFVDLAIRTLDFVGNSQTVQWREQYQQATSLAQEGLSLRSALLHWNSNSLLPFCLTGQDNQPETLIARVYYHTISIYLDGIFSS
ncbi:hypothetical protein E8E11_010520 [Didymella keratinophila]|nr:hypothetical protein E8E11_010520 [Didymella keratinophila]